MLNHPHIQECTEQFTRLFNLSDRTGQKKKEIERDDSEEGESERPPIDLIVDVIIGLLEHSTNFTRVIADQSFSMLTSMVTDTTVDLILAVC